MSSKPNLTNDILDEEKEKIGNNDPYDDKNVLLKVEEQLKIIELQEKSKRKKLRLRIMSYVLLGIGIAFIISIAITCIFVFNDKEISIEIIILNTILGSSLTTIIGVIAGTSID